MKRAEINGFVITIEGTWCEVSNGHDVVFNGSVSEDATPEEVFNELTAKGWI